MILAAKTPAVTWRWLYPGNSLSSQICWIRAYEHALEFVSIYCEYAAVLVLSNSSIARKCLKIAARGGPSPLDSGGDKVAD